jgi:hypothetical protein
MFLTGLERRWRSSDPWRTKKPPAFSRVTMNFQVLGAPWCGLKYDAELAGDINPMLD